MIAVADALPHPLRQAAPYTLLEAISELGAYAESVTSSAWAKSKPVQKNRLSLVRELDAQSSVLGTRLRAHVSTAVAALRATTGHASLVAACAAFDNVWRSKAAISAALEDLCAEAQSPGAHTARLRQLAGVVASQLGADALSHFSPLREAADILSLSEEELSRWRRAPIPQPFDEAARLRLAAEMVTASPVGRVVVWAVYSRATAWGMRTDLGSVVVLRPDWALPNAFNDDGHDFPERAELRDIQDHVRWMEELQQLSTEPDTHLALVRVDLGERRAAGATDAARRLIHAILAVPVTAGGVSWHDTGASATLLDGAVRTLSLGPLKTAPTMIDDGYGVGATAEILHEEEGRLGQALHKRPLPDHLVEALSSLREARMTDHRDVTFYGARPVSPRFATALEDHAMELIASVMAVPAEKLAQALERRYALELAEHRALRLVMSPFERTAATEPDKRRDTLEAEVARFTAGGVQVVNVPKVVASAEDIRALSMTPIQRTEFEDGLLICTDPIREQQLLIQAGDDAAVLRARHRRVRNAVNHGLPLAPVTLGSVREYAESTSQHGLDLALTWFIDGRSGSSLISRDNKRWSDRHARVGRGISWVQEEARMHQPSSADTSS